MAQVSYDRSSLITPYSQPDKTSCAHTCAGMCMNKSPQDLIDKGIDLKKPLNWDEAGKAFGYTCSANDKASLSVALSLLKSGFPVIAKVNDVEATQHWVVITKFSGDDAVTPLDAANFKCVDPSGGIEKVLKNATNYAGVYKTRVYKKA